MSSTEADAAASLLVMGNSNEQGTFPMSRLPNQLEETVENETLRNRSAVVQTLNSRSFQVLSDVQINSNTSVH